MSPPSRITTDKTGDWRAAKRLLPYLWEYRTRIAIGLVCLVLGRVANVVVPIALKEIVDALDRGDPKAILILPIALIIGYGLLRFAAVLFSELRNVVFIKASVQIIERVSNEIFSHLHRLSLSFHLDRKTGALSRDVERGTSSITYFLRIIVFSIVPIVFEITAVLFILWHQFDLGFVLVTLSTIALYVAFTFFVTRWRTHFRIAMNVAESAASTRSLDSLLNYETVKVFGNEVVEQERYGDALKGWVSSSIKTNISLAFLNIGQGLIIAFGITVLMIMAANGVADGELTLGDFAMVNAFLIQLYIPLSFLGSIYRDLNHSLIDMEKMFDLIDVKPDVTESKDAIALDLGEGEIEFDNVSFSYIDNQPILKNVSFKVPGAHMVAVVGPSGAGKSTLSRLLLRFYDPLSGQVKINGKDIRGVTLSSLRSVMGVVPQDTVLFNDTIGYNIGYGNLDASQADIEEAAKIAQIDDFIRQHPQGYDILVGERGLKLSGGEKQRVAIARTALKGARILIFDEATSSLDSRSEKVIQKALDRVSKGCTTLVIAHRLSTVVKADQIIVLDQGSIAEQGTHTELLEKAGLYKQMWDLQQQGDELPLGK